MWDFEVKVKIRGLGMLPNDGCTQLPAAIIQDTQRLAIFILIPRSDVNPNYGFDFPDNSRP